MRRPNQNGFRPGRSTTQQIQVLRRIIEECSIKKDLNCVVSFIDFNKAFDYISRQKLKEILLAYGIPEKVVALVMIFYIGTTAQVITPDGPSEEFDISAGVLQGDTLAPFIFVIVVDYVLRNNIIETGEEVGFTTVPRKSRRCPAKYITDLDFADDIALLSDDKEKAQRLLLSTEEWALSVGLCINKSKTECMNVGQTTNDQTTLQVREGDIKEVEDFKYLGSWVKSSSKDFYIRRAQAFDASERMWQV